MHMRASHQDPPCSRHILQTTNLVGSRYSCSCVLVGVNREHREEVQLTQVQPTTARSRSPKTQMHVSTYQASTTATVRGACHRALSDGTWVVFVLRHSSTEGYTYRPLTWSGRASYACMKKEMLQRARTQQGMSGPGWSASGSMTQHSCRTDSRTGCNPAPRTSRISMRDLTLTYTLVT